MRLADLLGMVTGSSPHDWAVVVQPEAHDHGHDHVAVLRDDVAISLAWGMTDEPRFSAGWLSAFPDSGASSHYVDVRYNGVPVLREVLVLVDAARAYLPVPLPGTGELIARRTNVALARLVQALTAGDDSLFDEHWDRLGVRVVA